MKRDKELQQYGRLMSLADIEEALGVSAGDAMRVMTQLPWVHIEDEWGVRHPRVLTTDLAAWCGRKQVSA